MAKFIVLLLSTLFAHSVLTTPLLRTSDAEDIKEKLEKVRDDAINSIQSLNLDNVERRRAIVSHSSEFAHKVQEAVNKIFRTFVRVDERYSHRILPKVALRLNDVTHEVQEVLITKPSVLRRTLQENVRKVSGVVTKLLEVLRYFDEHNDEGRLGHDVKDIVDKLIDAIHQLHVRSDMHFQTHEINGKVHQELGNEIVNTLNKITWYDRTTYELLRKTIHNFDHTLNHILHHFQNEVAHFSDSERSKFEDVLKCLHSIRVQLNSVILHKNGDVTNINRNIDDFKTQLRLTIHNVNVEIQKLVTIGQGLKDSRSTVIDNSIRNIAADSLHGEQRVLWKLQELLRVHNVTITV